MGNGTCNLTPRDYNQTLINLFGKAEPPHLWRVNGLVLLNTILMGVVVCVGSYAPRYRRHPLMGLLYLGATVLFLPIVSLVATPVSNQHPSSNIVSGQYTIQVFCSPSHIFITLIWTGVVLIIGINTSGIVVGDAREGRNIDPPTELLIKAIWTAYLTLHMILVVFHNLSDIEDIIDYWISVAIILGQLFAIMFTKLLFKYSVFCNARRSFAFGRSPRLIAGYMAQLQQPGESQRTSATDHQVNDEHAVPPPALVVMGEDNVQVEKQPHGYNFKRINSNRLVTLDRVWRLDDMDVLLRSLSAARPKDVCFSFALFKLLRCRFAKYTVFEAGFMKAHKFFLHTLIQADDYQRMFGVIADELSFIYDYYYSSLPISYSHRLLPILSTTLSVYSIAYCLFVIINLLTGFTSTDRYQIDCFVWCQRGDERVKYSDRTPFGFGSLYFDLIPLYLVLAALVLAEIKDIIFYMCSNWTKVALICNYGQQSPAVQKCIGFVFKHFRSKLVNNWADKMNQCSILVRHPREISLLVRRLLRLPNQKKIMVPSAVKKAVFEALQGLASEQEARLLLSKHIRGPRPPIAGSLSANGDQHIGYAILVWHIATSIFEMRHPQQPDPEGHRTAAIHLSRYCAYLVACCPDLLPDDDEWCKQLYKDVKKDVDRVVSAEPEAEFEQLVHMLRADPNHEVLRNGAELGKRLVDSDTEWKELARFWSEMILYVAPSENLEAHAEAIARGGELVTLLWALLAHAGIVGRLAAGGGGTSAAGHV